MTYQEILAAARILSVTERASLVSALSLESVSPSGSPRLSRLLDKRGGCPHCGGKHYCRFGKDKGANASNARTAGVPSPNIRVHGRRDFTRKNLQDFIWD